MAAPESAGCDHERWRARCIAQIEARLLEVLAEERARRDPLGPACMELLDALETAALGGGKRMRSTLMLLAFVGAGGSSTDPRAVNAGAALELLHTGCLVHDDIMDSSRVRRGHPTIHATFEGLHRARAWSGAPERFGESVAVIVGDLAFFYAMKLMVEANPDAQRIFFEISADAGVGQYLDLQGAVRRTPVHDDAATISRYKTARYSVEGPLLLGAALAGQLPQLAEPLSAYGQPVGEAFQLKDDLLGAFGDPADTGKPVGDDLLQGKCTRLLAFASEERRCRLPSNGFAMLDQLQSDTLAPDDVRALQGLLIELGAHERAENVCDALAARAIEAIQPAPIGAEAKKMLGDFAMQVAHWPVSYGSVAVS